MEVTVKDIQVTDKFGISWLKKTEQGQRGLVITFRGRTFALAWQVS